jgi:rhamnulokinase
VAKTVRVAAVDLGATSGRVMAVTVGAGELELQEVYRFRTAPSFEGHHLVTPTAAIMAEIKHGLEKMAVGGPIDAIGIDCWAVDYGLLDDDDRLINPTVNYRDTRTNGMSQIVGQVITNAKLYAATGMQYLPFNTIYQLVAETQFTPERLEQARTLLLLPDLMNYWLTGKRVAEITNASTTALVDQNTKDWQWELITKLGLAPNLFPEIVAPGTVIGPVNPEIAQELQLPANTPVVAVASHDTASAVVAAPLTPGAAYISSGTWSLVGLELDKPVLTEAARAINATNELGADGTVRFLRNTMGLWLVSQCVEEWNNSGKSLPALVELQNQISRLPRLRWIIDADSPEFLAPGDMPSRVIAAAVALPDTTQAKPETVLEIMGTIYDSLALAYRISLRELADVASQKVAAVNIVGGGAQNHLLSQLTADATGLPVTAGPVEAAALGNALIQARALGVFGPEANLQVLRDLVRKTQSVTNYEPNHTEAELWNQAEAVLRTLRL